MQHFTFEKLSEEQILLATALVGWDMRTDMPEFLRAFHAALDACQAPVYCIVDIRTNHPPSLDDVIWGANEGTRGASAITNHPKIREILAISQNPLLTLAAKGIRSDIFGNVRISVYPTLEKALEYARAQP